VKFSNKKFSFFSSRNQYFPHIPYVASKKDFPKISKENGSGRLEPSENAERD
jgi:hypothetical protein